MTVRIYMLILRVIFFVNLLAAFLMLEPLPIILLSK